MKLSFPLLAVLVAIAAGAAGAAGYMFMMSGGGERDPGSAAPRATDLRGEDLIGQRRPDYNLGSADGSIVSASDFDGQVVLVNFWATWCAPCREEMPMLMDLRARYKEDGLEVVGIAIDDVAMAREFISELGIEYPNLVGSTDVMATLRLYGNISGVLPYSVLVDRNGIVRWTHLGVLETSALESEIENILAKI
jgi:peroxiredoxin